MPHPAICYAVGPQDVLPAVASAVQARNLAPDAQEIFVCVLGADRAMEQRFDKICRINRIGFRAVAPAVLDGQKATDAKLFLDRILPAHVRTFLLLDASVQVWDGLDELLAMTPPDGGFLAAADALAFGLDSKGPGAARRHEYLDGLGLDAASHSSYVSTAVVLGERDSWSRLAADALRLLRARPEAMTQGAESALNAAAAGRQKLISLRWNFPIFLRACALENFIQPAIYTFTSGARPWHGTFAPWNETFTRPYSSLLQAFPDIAPHSSRLPAAQRLRLRMEQSWRTLEHRLAWSLSDKREAVLAYESLLSREANQTSPQPHAAPAQPALQGAVGARSQLFPEAA